MSLFFTGIYRNRIAKQVRIIKDAWANELCNKTKQLIIIII